MCVCFPWLATAFSTISRTFTSQTKFRTIYFDWKTCISSEIRWHRCDLLGVERSNRDIFKYIKNYCTVISITFLFAIDIMSNIIWIIPSITGKEKTEFFNFWFYFLLVTIYMWTDCQIHPQSLLFQSRCTVRKRQNAWSSSTKQHSLTLATIFK